MCGIAGFLDPAGRVDRRAATLSAMARAIAHRGPDDEGVHLDERAGLGFAFRRLAVQDLGATGRQPMLSPSGRLIAVFNGEIYNVAELRAGLDPGLRLRGTSDTEVLLALIDQRGLRAALDAAVGMFAFAVWCEAERELVLVRDRLGVKPLYVGLAGGAAPDGPTLDGIDLGRGGGALVFASELKALRPVEAMRFDVDPAALSLFLRHSYVPGPWTIHPAVRSLPPGHLLRVRDGRCSVERWWSAKDRFERSAPFAGSLEEATEETRRLLATSVRERLIGDVPVGAFLSGGIDSSVVVATMADVAPGAVRTYTIAMDDARYDEAERAEAVARALGVEHVTMRFTADEAMRLVPSLPSIWDEPFGDSSQLATHLVARLARRHVTVALSGDGGDEVFGGYERYRRLPSLWNAIGRVPHALRAPLATLLERAAPALEPIAGDRVHKVAPLLREDSAWSAYLRLTSVVPDPGAYLLEAPEHVVPLTDPAWLLASGPLERRMMHADLVSYLPDDILVKVDRATMAVGLEAREPLLDHRLIEFLFRLPPNMLVRDGVTKPILRRLLAERLPPELVHGPKRGFAVPLLAWLQGPLRGWVEDLLDLRRLREGGRFRPEAVRSLWESVLRGERLEHRLWNILMFQAWEARWGRG